MQISFYNKHAQSNNFREPLITFEKRKGTGFEKKVAKYIYTVNTQKEIRWADIDSKPKKKKTNPLKKKYSKGTHIT